MNDKFRAIKNEAPNKAWPDATWSAFVREYEPALTGFFVKRVSDAAEARDLVQEVFCRLMRRSTQAGIDNPRGYVFRVARSVLVDKARRDAARQRANHDPFDPVKHGGSDFSPERVLIGRQSLARLLKAVRTLPQRTQDVFVLRALENMKYRDIAETMGLSVRACEKHMAKALAHLGEALDEEE